MAKAKDDKPRVTEKELYVAIQQMYHVIKRAVAEGLVKSIGDKYGDDVYDDLIKLNEVTEYLTEEMIF